MGGDGLMTNKEDYILHLEDVYVRYYNLKGKIFTVLNDIDLQVKTGEFITIVGPSGSGKSTLLRLIMGSESMRTSNPLSKG